MSTKTKLEEHSDAEGEASASANDATDWGYEMISTGKAPTGRYFALLDGGPGAYGVVFPDCLGCTAMGSDENEACANAVEALGEWVHDARAAGDRPAARGIEALRLDAEVTAALAEGAVFLSVPLVIETGRPVKANISLDRGLLDAIDAAARRSGLTRSGFLASAARDKIAAAG